MTARARPRLAVEEFRKLRDSAPAHASERVELLEGVLVTHPAATPEHLRLRDRLRRSLQTTLEGRADVRTDQAIALSYQCEPVVDLCVVRHSNDAMPGDPVQPSEVVLVIEIADARRSLLRRVKAPACLEGGIADMWIVDPVGRHIECLRSQRIARVGDEARVAQLPGLFVTVADLFRELRGS